MLNGEQEWQCFLSKWVYFLDSLSLNGSKNREPSISIGVRCPRFLLCEESKSGNRTICKWVLSLDSFALDGPRVATLPSRALACFPRLLRCMEQEWRPHNLEKHKDSPPTVSLSRCTLYFHAHPLLRPSGFLSSVISVFCGVDCDTRACRGSAAYHLPIVFNTFVEEFSSDVCKSELEDLLNGMDYCGGVSISCSVL